MHPALTLGLGLLALTTSSTAAPREYVIEERHIVVEKRQADVSQLLQLASLVGITALPTDPAVLLSLGPLANSLASALPTSSVLSVLVTAAPSGFVSSIINDPSYANSFESAFAAGSSPSWFNALPTDVKSYLHTYTGFGQLAGVAGAVAAGAAATSGGLSALGSGSGSGGAVTATATVSGSGSGSSGAAATAKGSESGSQSGSSTTTDGSKSSSATSETTAGGSAMSSATAGGASSTNSKGGAAAVRPTGVFAAGLVGAVGVLGVAVAL